MRVMVYEPLESGHRFAYLSHLLPAMHAFGVEPILVTSEKAYRSEAFKTQLGRHVSAFEVDATVELPERRPQWALASQFEKSLKRIQPGHCFVPVGDEISQVTGARAFVGMASAAKDIETEVLHFRGGFGYDLSVSRMATWKRRIAKRLLLNTPWQTFFHLDAFQLASLCKGQEQFSERCVVMPDGVESPPQVTKWEARDELGISGDGRVIGCAGGINQRKGIDLLLRAFATAQPQLRATDQLLLAGPMDHHVKQLVATQFRHLVDSKKLICFDRYLTVREFALVLPAMDVVSTPYPVHTGSSSIVIRAAAVGRPVVAADVDWIGRTVKKFALGRTCQVRDEVEFSAAIVEALDDSEKFCLTEEAKQFVQFHSIENFSATWLGRLSQKLNRPLEAKRIPWKWDGWHSDHSQTTLA